MLLLIIILLLCGKLNLQLNMINYKKIRLNRTILVCELAAHIHTYLYCHIPGSGIHKGKIPCLLGVKENAPHVPTFPEVGWELQFKSALYPLILILRRFNFPKKSYDIFLYYYYVIISHSILGYQI
jgi:hypothetical protein